MLKKAEQDHVYNIIYKLNMYSQSNPILPKYQLDLLGALIEDLKKSDQTIRSIKKLIEQASIRLGDQIMQEAILSSPFAWSLSQQNNPDIRSFMQGLLFFKSPFIAAVWLESILWSGNINQCAEESLQRWGLDKNVTELQKILEECKTTLILESQPRRTDKTNWYRVGFYAAASIGITLATQWALSEAEESNSTLII